MLLFLFYLKGSVMEEIKIFHLCFPPQMSAVVGAELLKSHEPSSGLPHGCGGPSTWAVVFFIPGLLPGIWVEMKQAGLI